MYKMCGSIAGILFAGIWVLGWTAGTLFFDYQLVNGFFKQLATAHYSTVTGRITHSEVLDNSDSDGSSYEASIHYQYSVHGQNYTSSTVCYGMKSASKAWADSVVLPRPAGSAIAVYYNPTNPRDAVLLQGIDGTLLIALIFIIPFNIIGLGALNLMLSGLRAKSLQSQPGGGVPIRSEGTSIRASLHTFTPLMAAAVAMLASSFALAIVLVLTTGAHPAPLWPGILALLLIAASGVFAWQWSAARIGSGRTDLVIDRLRQTLHLPQTCGRKAPVAVKLDELAAIEIAYDTNLDSEGTRTDYYSPTVAWCDAGGAVRSAKLIQWTDKARADSFVKWLREEVGKQFAK